MPRRAVRSADLPEARLWTACGFGNDPLLLTEGQGRGFSTSIHVVRVSTKLLKILIAALSPSVAYFSFLPFSSESER